jgi:elongation factor G
VTDFLELERARGITIQSAAITFHWPLPENCKNDNKPKTINLIDTPGHQDFRFEVDRCLPVLDGAVCIIDSVKGVEAHTERVWASAQEFGIPRIAFVNKLDRDGASFKRSVLDIGARLNGWPLVCQLPWWDKDQFVGVIDVIDRVGYRWQSEKKMFVLDYNNLREALSGNQPLLDEIKLAREKLIEGLAEWDEEVMEQFAEDPGQISGELLRRGIRRAIRSGDGNVVPVLAGASFRNIGVELLMDAVVDYLPSPDERPEIEVRSGTKQHKLVKLLDEKHDNKPGHQRLAAVASVFKVFNHPKEGLLSYVRVYHGTLHKNTPTWNTHALTIERPLGLVQISAGKTDEISHLSTGHIGAIKGLKKARTGDTLIASVAALKAPPNSLKHLHIRSPETPPAVAFLAIEPYGNVAAKELQLALENASREDPSLRWNRDEKTEQFVLQGMGKLHLDIAVHNIRQRHKIEADFGQIEVDYKECLTASARPQHVVFDKVVANKAGKVTAAAVLEPLEEHHHETILESTVEKDGNYIHIKIPVPDDGRPLNFDLEDARQQVLNGVLAALARGPRRGSPVQGCHATITIETDSDSIETPSGGHFSGAANRAVRDALKEAHEMHKVGILEPVMKVNITCPETTAGVVQHDITSGAGGHVLEVTDLSGGTNTYDGMVDVSKIYCPPDPYESVTSLRASKATTRMVEIVAKVPFKEMLDYDSHLRSKTGGRHSMTMAFDSFDRVVGARERTL